MGRSRRNKPLKLSHKLLAIRKHLQMSQTQMAQGARAEGPLLGGFEFRAWHTRTGSADRAALRATCRHTDGDDRR